MPNTPEEDADAKQPDGEAAAEDISVEEQEQEKHSRHLKEILALVLMVILVGVAIFQLPKIFRSIGLELFGRQAVQLYEFPSGTLLDPKDESIIVDNRDFYTMSFLSIDEAKGFLDFVVSGNRTCNTALKDEDPVLSRSPNHCYQLQVVLYSLQAVEPYRRGLPPSTTLTIAAGEEMFSTPGQLPLIGQPSLYPLDTYDLRLAISIIKIMDDGTKQPFTEDEYEAVAITTVRNAVHNFLIEQPSNVDPESIAAVDDPYPFIGAMDVRFERPTYLKTLAVMLVLMIAISSVITMLTRTVKDALLSVGGIVLGVWGVRSILVSSSVSVLTAIDITLSTVIFFLLLGIGIRIVKHLFDSSELPDPIPAAKNVVQRPRRDRPLT